MKLLFLALAFIGIVYGQNVNCIVTLPATPLSAAGLATPYILSGLNAATAGPCNQSNAGQTTFVEATIFQNNALNAYHPIIIDMGSQPAIVPTAPNLNANAIIGIWFGSNAATITLMGNGVAAGSCINGNPLPNNPNVFGQVAFCNAISFFAAVNAAILNGLITVPPLGMANDGQACPTTRDFFVVDQDPSDNVVTAYLITNVGGRVAQNTSTNINTLQAANFMTMVNPSDEGLLGILNAAMGCAGWPIPSLDDPNVPAMIPTVATNELQATKWQQPPIAYIPLGDPMARTNNQPDITKVNMYRQGVNQPLATLAEASTVTFCQFFYQIQPRRLLLNFKNFVNLPSPATNMANSLYTFLAMRYSASFGIQNLNCVFLLGVNNPVNLTTNGGIVVGAVIIPPAVNTGTSLPTATHNSASGLYVNGFLLIACILFAYFARH